MKKLMYIIILSFYFGHVNSQINELNHEKYWFYRKRLLNQFMVSGEDNPSFVKKSELNDPRVLRDNRIYVNGCGLSIPVHGYSINIWNRKGLQFAESTIELGSYMAMLATELRLLYDYNQPYENTQRELYFALQALERIDLAAEILIEKNAGESDGFFLRDDADYNLINNFKYLVNNFAIDTLTSHMRRAYMTDKYEGKGNSIEQTKFDENCFMSPDQLSGVIFGLGMVKGCLEGISARNYNNGTSTIDMVEFVKHKAKQIGDRLEDDQWYIRFDNNKVCRYGTKVLCEGDAIGFAKALDYITDGAYNYTGYFPNIQMLFPTWEMICFGNLFLANGILAIFTEYDAEQRLDIGCKLVDDGNNSVTEVQKSFWNLKGLYSSDVTNVIVPGTGKAIGRFLWDKVMENGYDFTLAYTFKMAAIGNSWLNKDNANITSDALKFYGLRYDVEMFAMANGYLHGDFSIDYDFKQKLIYYLNSAPVDGPHHGGTQQGNQGICGWTASSKWNRPLKSCLPPDPASPKRIEMNGVDYMLMYNLIWLLKKNRNDLYGIDTYTYSNYYIYPTKCLNKAYFPLNIKTFEPIHLPDSYSPELTLNSTTPYQNGSYKFEAPEISMDKGFSIDSPAEFIISGDEPYDLESESLKGYDITDITGTTGCPHYIVDGSLCYSSIVPRVVDNIPTDIITYKWRLYRDSNLLYESEDGYTDAFPGWSTMNCPNANKIEVESYNKGKSLDKYSETLTLFGTSDCCVVGGTVLSRNDDEDSQVMLTNIFPNPTESFITVSNIEDNSMVVIYNYQGKVLEKISNVNDEIVMDMGNYPKGIYFARIINGENSECHKVIKK